MGKKEVFYKDSQHRLRHYSEDEGKVDKHESKKMVNKIILNEEEEKKIIKILEEGQNKRVHITRLTPEEVKKTRLKDFNPKKGKLLEYVDVYYYYEWGVQYVFTYADDEYYKYISEDVLNQLIEILNI
jgi:hypothetical protein